MLRALAKLVVDLLQSPMAKTFIAMVVQEVVSQVVVKLKRCLMNAFLKTILNVILPKVNVKQVVAMCLGYLLNKLLKGKTPEQIKEATDIVDCVLEGAVAAKAVVEKVSAVAADASVSSVESDEVVTSAMDAFKAWGQADSTPAKYKELFRK